GGGTPSLFSSQGIDAILSAVRARLPVPADAEITLEANPGTFEAEKFRQFRAAGINRLSIGIQSFNPAHLKMLGRIHDEAEARHAIEIAKRDFDNVNLDIMYALPAQTAEEAFADIGTAISFLPQHVSAYHLTIEPNTYFYRYPPQVPDSDASAGMQAATEEALAAAGYEHYETSAFARPGKRSRHNLNYWTFGDYLGIGAGAHSKLSFPDRIVRQMRYRQPKQYMESAMAGSAVQQEQEVGAREVGFEFMMNALRLNDGFDAGLFAERAGVPLNTVLKELDEAEKRGLITRDHLRIAPTLLGRRFLNDLLQIFLAEPGETA
ncbi:MAG: radical SAM family heme chaperone HemW, partial [Burkholderiales bacterium]|nr:radical SAM family heme chaperone HemW [Burkholderiales bacterium]